MTKKKDNFVTPRQFAEIHGVNYQTVMWWLRKDLIKGAVKYPLPYGGHVYQVPNDAPKPELTPGPKPKAKADTAKAKKATIARKTKTQA